MGRLSAKEPGAWRLPIGTVGSRIGKYHIREVIGFGAMGSVVRATDTALDRNVAIKVMSPNIARDAEHRDRFHREARAAGSLQHPNIITVYDFGEAEGHPYIAMECLEGRDLKSIIRDGDDFTLEHKLDITLDVLKGLSYAHARAIVHRDIKPANVRLTADGRAKILDFGIAHLADSDLTSPGLVPGTPAFIAPEMLRGERPAPRGDLFAVGALMYELVTSRSPFAGENTPATLYNIVHEQPAGLGDNSTIPAAVRRVLCRALEKDPNARYQTADEMIADITAAKAARMSDVTTEIVDAFTAPAARPWRLPLATMAVASMAVFVAPLGLNAPSAPEGLLQALAIRGTVVTAPDTTPVLVEMQPAAPATEPPASPPARQRPKTSVAAVRLAAVTPEEETETPPANREAVTAPPSTPLPQLQTAGIARRVVETRNADDVAISRAVDALEHALETRDIERVAGVYPGLTPRERAGWDRFFGFADDLDVQLTLRNLDVVGDSASAQLAGRLVYHGTAGKQERPITFAIAFGRVDRGWAIARLGN